MNKLVIIAIVGTLLVGSFGGAWAAATITGADIVDKSITAIDLATDSVDGAKIKNLSIKTGDLGDAIVTSGKIKDGTIQRQDIASGMLPSGATTVIYGTCHVDIQADADGFDSGVCLVPGAIMGDAVVGNIAGLAEPGTYDVKLESLTTQPRDPDEEDPNNKITWIIKNDGDEPIDITTVLQYIVYNNNINQDG